MSILKTKPYDVIIIGSGSIGTPTAMNLAQAGYRAAELLDGLMAGRIGGPHEVLVEPLRVDLIRRQGYTSSVKVPDTNGLSATISWSAKYSAVDLSNAPAIEEAIGKDLASQFFTREMKITVKDVTEDALRDLIQSVGPERFAQFFAVERWLSPTKAYTERFYAAFNEKERAALSPIVRQYKPSVKVK